VNVLFSSPIVGFRDPVAAKQPETKYLERILHAPKKEQKSVLLHPSVQIFLDLKWEKVRWMILMNIAYQVRIWQCCLHAPLKASLHFYGIHLFSETMLIWDCWYYLQFLWLILYTILTFELYVPECTKMSPESRKMKRLGDSK